jgi:glycosyltransferase involved in cell wall biosynthesis
MADKNPKVSVIIPAYNEERYLARCLDSVISQTLDEIEIILVNDGSTDGTYGICEKYLKKYLGKVMVIHKRNEGIGLARNTGIEMASGEYIGFVDADDWIDKNMYKEMYDTAVLNHSDVVVCDVKKIFVSEGKEQVEVSMPCESPAIDIGKYIKDGLNPAYSWNKLYKREIWGKFRFKKMVYEDLDIVLTILGNCDKVSYVQKPFNTYYKRPGSITTTYENIRLLDMMKAYEDAVFNSNPKYRKETVYCIAKRILINLETPGLSVYRAEFTELIHKLLPEFESNEFILQDETINQILKYKNKNTISKDFYYVGCEKEEGIALNEKLKKYVKGYQLHKIDEPGFPEKVFHLLYEKGGIYADEDMILKKPIGELRASRCFFVFSTKGDKLMMAGTQKENSIIQEIMNWYQTSNDLRESINNILGKYGWDGGVQSWGEDILMRCD